MRWAKTHQQNCPLLYNTRVCQAWHTRVSFLGLSVSKETGWG
ncbi:hypothetical protein HMPREF1991_02889 [Hoylesella loescheii DSM 19665 = JCM 12249 = ATCC 15930]|uniref:Uncharacterized protein n=1 Tax=Hoylesella loescheii DSM 19665 = JCM 12249 = ATCC 15930 TaxID=1122985 RepID=A0A069QMJ5_HOYLO|nr:hypothetical protein HMPREF1991_02889 [Hoylesella loescheii DSM 19665 = JCM 12249 = ATCC 15930]